MSKRKIMILAFIAILIVIGFGIFNKNNKEEENTASEIVPEEEISEDQERETMIVLYFENIETGELTKEVRILDVKELTLNPYKVLIEKLIEGPKSDKLKRVIPEGTKINNVYMQGDVVYVDFSKEFIENCKNGIENETKLIYSIVNTLTELNEVTYVKVLIDGEKNKEFNDGKMNFIEEFEKND